MKQTLIKEQHVSKNSKGKVKFCFSDSHGNLKIKFSDNKDVSCDSVGPGSTGYETWQQRDRTTI